MPLLRVPEWMINRGVYLIVNTQILEWSPHEPATEIIASNDPGHTLRKCVTTWAPPGMKRPFPPVLRLRLPPMQSGVEKAASPESLAPERFPAALSLW